MLEARADGGARLRCSVLATHVRRAGEAPLFVGGSYDNHVVRTPDGWRIDRFAFTPAWTSGDLSVVSAAR